jgi:hypothetical protein
LLHAIVHSAGIQDRDGGILLLATLFGQFPFLETLFADSAYSYLVSKLKLSNDLSTPRDSCDYPSVGSSNAPSHGSTVVAASTRIGEILCRILEPSLKSRF